jgi:hypothetical protein
MKILSSKLSRFLNGEHFEFITEVIALVNKYGDAALDVVVAFAALVAAYAKEKLAIDPIRKSRYTELINEADNIRDTTFIGLREMIKAAMKHFDEQVRASAEALMIVFKSFGPINRVGKDSESGHVTKLITDLQTTYAADVATVGVAEWVVRLDAENRALEALVERRYEEWNSRTDLRMVDVRAEVDAAYHALTERVNALYVIHPRPDGLAFIEELNLRIKHYDTIVKEREAHNAAIRKDLSDADISSIADQLYAGGAHITPLVEVFYKGERLVEEKDYTIVYSNNINVGTATVTIKAKGEYAGKKMTTFNIVRQL